MAARKNDREKLYGSIKVQTFKHGLYTRKTAKVEVRWNPLLIAALGHYNPLTDEDRPSLEEVKKLQDVLSAFGISPL
jgi:uncharacterized protein (DUF2225 family)